MMPTATAAAAGDGMQFVFDSCLSGCDCGIDRRPYHRNCGCALHSRGCLRKVESSCNSSKVAFRIRKSWSEGSLALACAAAGGGYGSFLKGSPHAAELVRRREVSMNQLMNLSAEEDETTRAH